MTNVATFDNIPKASLGTDSDMFLVRQNGVAVSQDRGTLSSSLGNSKWNTTADYLVGSEVIHNNKRYRALQDNGVSFSNISIPDKSPTVWLDLQDALDNKYSPNNKPTASDIQALALTGGTLIGELRLENGSVYTITKGKHIYTAGENGHIHTDGKASYIETKGQDSHISTRGQGAHIRTMGDGGNIYVENGKIYTVGSSSHIHTMGNNANVYTQGLDAKIYTKGARAHIYTEQGEILEQGQRVYSPNNKPTARDFLLDDNSNVQDKISSLLDEIDALKLRLDALE